MAGEIYIADKETLDLVKAKTDLIGDASPIIGDTTTVMNYMKKIEDALDSQNGYSPKVVGSFYSANSPLCIPIADKYLLIEDAGKYPTNVYSCLGILPKGSGALLASVNNPDIVSTTRFTFNLDAGYAYFMAANTVKAFNILTGAASSKAVSGGSSFSETAAFPLANDDVVVVNSAKTQWCVYSPDLSVLKYTITADVIPGTTQTFAFDSKNNIAYFAYSSDVKAIQLKAFSINTATQTASQIYSSTITFCLAGNAQPAKIGIYLTDNYVICHNFYIGSFVILDRINSYLRVGSSSLPLSNAFSPVATPTTGLIGGLEANSKTALFYDLGNDKFLIIKAHNVSTEKHDENIGVIAMISDGKVIPLRTISSKTMKACIFREASADHYGTFLSNMAFKDGRIAINGIEYDISDLL